MGHVDAEAYLGPVVNFLYLNDLCKVLFFGT